MEVVLWSGAAEEGSGAVIRVFPDSNRQEMRHHKRGLGHEGSTLKNGLMSSLLE
jgi:hypothetical protein